MRVGDLADELLPKALHIDGGEASVVHLQPSPDILNLWFLLCPTCDSQTRSRGGAKVPAWPEQYQQHVAATSQGHHHEVAALQPHNWGSHRGCDPASNASGAPAGARAAAWRRRRAAPPASPAALHPPPAAPETRPAPPGRPPPAPAPPPAPPEDILRFQYVALRKFEPAEETGAHKRVMLQ
jgi:hypothetical protein